VTFLLGGKRRHELKWCDLQSRIFFALPESEKQLIQRSSDRSHHCGYSGIGNEKVREQRCMKEGFTCGNPKEVEQPNIWPSEERLPGFRSVMEEFFDVSLYHQATS
jgi:isopenicillin N synthase-like dioxygenase